MTVHFLHVGKTGGSALGEALAPHYGDDTRFGEMVLHDHFTRLADLPSGDAAFLFVRDPVARFISGFDSRHRKGRPRNSHPWSAEEVVAFGRFRSAADLAEALADGVATAEEAMESIGHVRRRLVHWFGLPEEANLNKRQVFVGRLERYDADLVRLGEFLGLDRPLSAPTDPIKAHIAPNKTIRPLSSRGTEAIRRWYCDDYELLDRLFPGEYGQSSVLD
mgnify:CR=1 FL=1